MIIQKIIDPYKFFNDNLPDSYFIQKRERGFIDIYIKDEKELDGIFTKKIQTKLIQVAEVITTETSLMESKNKHNRKLHSVNVKSKYWEKLKPVITKLVEKYEQDMGDGVITVYVHICD